MGERRDRPRTLTPKRQKVTREFTFDRFGDTPNLWPGLLLVGPRAKYRILDARPVESRLWHDRWKLRVERLADDTPVVAPWISFVAYAKGETAQDVARSLGLPPPPLA